MRWRGGRCSRVVGILLCGIAEGDAGFGVVVGCGGRGGGGGASGAGAGEVEDCGGEGDAKENTMRRVSIGITGVLWN